MTIIIAAITLLIAGALSFKLYQVKQQELKENAEAELHEESLAALTGFLDGMSECGQGKYSGLCAESFAWQLLSEVEIEPGTRYSYSVDLTHFDLVSFFDDCKKVVQNDLSLTVSEASRLSEIYDDELNYLPEILTPVIDNALQEVEQHRSDYLTHDTIDIDVVFTDDGRAEVQASAELDRLLFFLSPGEAERYAENALNELQSELEFIPVKYRISDSAACGYFPDPEGYGETSDPEEIKDLLSSPRARQLTAGRKVVWNPQLDFIPGTDFKYYIDESMLVLIWYEPTANACGTYCEVFLSDASQLRRKLVDVDSTRYGYALATELSSQANAAAAVSGDLYDHWQREIGICVNNGAITRFSQRMCDVCWVDRKGDLHITFENDINDFDEALEFIGKNDIVFSLCFGPALIIDGVNVTPDTYPWGEINEDFPRCAISQIDTLHYLALTVTCARPHYLPDWGCTIRELGSALTEHNAKTAYTLDGGRTGEIILRNKIVSPFNYDSEQNISDIIYFASAVPD